MCVCVCVCVCVRSRSCRVHSEWSTSVTTCWRTASRASCRRYWQITPSDGEYRVKRSSASPPSASLDSSCFCSSGFPIATSSASLSQCLRSRASAMDSGLLSVHVSQPVSSVELRTLCRKVIITIISLCWQFIYFIYLFYLKAKGPKGHLHCSEVHLCTYIKYNKTQ